MSVAILRVTRYFTGSLCSCCSAGLMCDRRSRLSTNRAAAFCSRCSGASVVYIQEGRRGRSCNNRCEWTLVTLLSWCVAALTSHCPTYAKVSYNSSTVNNRRTVKDRHSSDNLARLRRVPNKMNSVHGRYKFRSSGNPVDKSAQNLRNLSQSNIIHTHSVLTAIFPSKPGLARCPHPILLLHPLLDRASPPPRQTQTLHATPNTIPPGPPRQWRRQNFASGGTRFGFVKRPKIINLYRTTPGSILPSMRYCIRPVCHSHTIIKWSSLKITHVYNWV